MEFWRSPIAVYAVQSVLHGLVALVVTEVTIQAWQVHDARMRFRFRLAILILAAGMGPLFQLFDPSRGSFYFRLNVALFDSQRWLGWKFWGALPLVGWITAVVLGGAAVVTLMQELAPALRRSKEEPPRSSGPAPDAVRIMLGELARSLALKTPTLTVLDLPGPVIVTSGVRDPGIIVSQSLLDRLSPREVRAALAHELAHVVRRSNLTTLVVFFLRVVMLYNPVALLVFRRLVQDDEQVCDQMTVEVTSDSEALAGALTRLLEEETSSDDSEHSVRERIEEGSFRLLLTERIERLRERPEVPHVGARWEGLFVNIVAIMGICYFIV